MFKKFFKIIFTCTLGYLAFGRRPRGTLEAESKVSIENGWVFVISLIKWFEESFLFSEISFNSSELSLIAKPVEVKLSEIFKILLLLIDKLGLNAVFRQLSLRLKFFYIKIFNRTFGDGHLGTKQSNDK